MTVKIHSIHAGILGLALFGLLNLGLAQVPAPPADAKPRPPHTLRIALADARSPLRDLIVQSGEKVFQPAQVTPFQISEPLVLKAMPEQLNFLVKGADDSTTVLASVAVPPGLKHALVVLVPKSDRDTPSHQAFLINEADFPERSIWLLNGSTNPVAIQIAAEKHTIPAGATQLLQPKLKDGDPFSVQAFSNEKNKWNIFSSTRWVLPTGQRHLVFFYVNARTQRMDYNSLTDFISN